MKINKILTLFLSAGCILLASTSCTREELNLPVREDPTRIPVSFSLSVPEMEPGTPETKTVMEPEIEGGETVEQQVKNFAVLQFEGSGSEAKLAAAPDYFADASEFFTGTRPVSLLPTTAEHPGPFIIVVTANIGGASELPNIGTTLGQFQANPHLISSYNSVFLEESGNKYLRMNGSVSVDTPIDDFFSTTVNLIRSVSKITIKVKNQIPSEEKVSLDKAQLRDINAKYYYLTPLKVDKKPDYTDAYSAANPCRIDKPQEDFPEAEEGVYAFTYYVPANLRGETDSQYQYTKGRNAPDGATRFCLYGTYGDDHTPINYTYFLGGNLENDFNLKPNHHYTYNITLKAKGDARYDYRVEDLAEVKFHTDANSYMVHPPKVAGQSRIYAIPIRRAATFWNKEGENGGVYGASQWVNYEDISITPDTVWEAEVLWNDFGLSNYSDFLIKSSGVGYDPTIPFDETDNTKGPYFKIKVKTGMKGNALVAVKVNDKIVWSWHIWITDYNPDQEGLTPKEGTYIYDVEGGQVHRYKDAINYNNAIWNREPTETTVGYKNAFIMDRYLGAWETKYEYKKALYFQFGRKDPFDPLAKGIALPTILFSATGEHKEMVDNIPLVNNIRFAVCNPDTFIGTHDVNDYASWTSIADNDKISGIEGRWFDPLYYSHLGDQDVLEIKKSIYDPCPAGWKIPDPEFINDIMPPTPNPIGTKPNRDVIEPADQGHYYYPNRKSNDPTTKIFFPSYSFITGTGGLATNMNGTWARLWTDKSNSKTKSYHITFQDVLNNYPLFTSHGYSVRCIREYGVVNK